MRHQSCTWPCLDTPSESAHRESNVAATTHTTDTSGVLHNDGDQQQQQQQQHPTKRVRLSKALGRVHSGGSGSGSTNPLSSSLLQRALEIFYARHHSVEFCSFLHTPSLEVKVLRHQSPFFAHALVALAGLYMSKEEAVVEGFADPAALSDWYTIVAREYSRQSVDVPSSKRASYALGRTDPSLGLVLRRELSDMLTRFY